MTLTLQPIATQPRMTTQRCEILAALFTAAHRPEQIVRTGAQLIGATAQSTAVLLGLERAEMIVAHNTRPKLYAITRYGAHCMGWVPSRIVTTAENLTKSTATSLYKAQKVDVTPPK